MSKPLAFGLNLAKKPSASKPTLAKRKPMFGGDDDSDDEGGASASKTTQVEEIGGDLDDFVSSSTATKPSQDSTRDRSRSKNAPPTQPPKLKSKSQPQSGSMFGDLSSSLTSRKNAEAAAELDASVYEYDAVYDSLKPQKPSAKEDKERRPKYMRGLMEAADVRKRDQLIAEEKKIAREREAEGDEYAGTEKFVTEGYKKQQEENKRLQEEEKRREEEEAKKNEAGGMSGFYKNMLNRDAQRHEEAMKAAEHATKNEPKKDGDADEENIDEEQQESNRAKELNEKGALIALNEDGQVVDKRQLLRGGLNLGAKRKDSDKTQNEDARPAADRERVGVSGQQIGNRQARRERQSRMMAEQLEETMKRKRDEEEAQRAQVENSAKSRKTEGEVMSAKERYLARKKASEEAKKNGTAEA